MSIFCVCRNGWENVFHIPSSFLLNATNEEKKPRVDSGYKILSYVRLNEAAASNIIFRESIMMGFVCFPFVMEMTSKWFVWWGFFAMWKSRRKISILKYLKEYLRENNFFGASEEKLDVVKLDTNFYSKLQYKFHEKHSCNDRNHHHYKVSHDVVWSIAQISIARVAINVGVCIGYSFASIHSAFSNCSTFSINVRIGDGEILVWRDLWSFWNEK